MGQIAGALTIVETEREALDVREQVAPQGEHITLADFPEQASEIIGQQAGEKSNEERRGARAIQNLHLAVGGVIQPDAQGMKRHTARLVGEHAVDHHLQGPGTKHAKRSIQHHRQRRQAQFLPEGAERGQKVAHPLGNGSLVLEALRVRMTRNGHKLSLASEGRA